MTYFQFPDGFIWGAATAALQIEGATDEGGRGASQWDVYRKEYPERFWQWASPDIACDHYHRYPADVALIKQLGHNGYRLSIAWPRIHLSGAGDLNQAGIDFYNRLFDALVGQGIQPNVTRYHWDLPQPLAQRGGWENRETVDAFARYAGTCFRLFGDRVKMWATINEPDTVVMFGYVTGCYPPCKQDFRAALLAAHNLNLAHARAVRCYHDLGQGGQIGEMIDLSAVYPATDTAEDAHAAQIADGMINRWFTDPVMLGHYPQDLLELYAWLSWLPELPDADLALLEANPLDWLGINYYFPCHASAGAAETSFNLNFLYIDRATLQRYRKQSSYWYQQVAEHNGF